MKPFLSKVFADVCVKVISGAILAGAGLLLVPSVRSFFGVSIVLSVWVVLLAGAIDLLGIAYLLRLFRPEAFAPRRAEWTEAELAKKITIEVSGKGEGVIFQKNVGGDGSVRIWIRVSNFTPFSIEIDRLFGEIWVGAPVGDLLYLKRDRIDSCSEAQIYVESSLTAEEVQRIEWQRRQRSDPPVSLNLNVHLATSRMMVKLMRPQLGTGNYRYNNFPRSQDGNAAKL